MTDEYDNPPCDLCTACCCKQTFGHDYAVIIEREEAAGFPEAVQIQHAICGELLVLPYVNGRCPHLGDDDRCQIYERRPQLCREFSCLYSYRSKGSRHGFFLEDNPQVVQLIEAARPEFAARQRAASRGDVAEN